jgi:prepilin-type N-terminal cleavage/methylation domain-containing protein
VRQPRAYKRAGVTLLELIVVIALLGLILAVAAPSFLVPEGNGTTELADLVGTARRTAVLRGEPVTLVIETNGAWRVDAAAGRSRDAIATGSLTVAVGKVRVHLTPLGACVLEPLDALQGVSWDAVSCVPVRTATAGARR